MAKRIIIDTEPRLPIDRMYAMERGAIVNGAQVGVTAVTVHAGHQFEIGDKALYALDDCNVLLTTVFTCTDTAASTVTLDLPFTYPDSARLVNIGPDTGGVVQVDGSYSRPNWDGSSIVLYSDGNGDDTIPYVAVRPDGRVECWSSVVPFWALFLDNGLLPVKFLMDAGTSSGGSETTRSATAPGAPSPGDTWIQIVDDGASPDIQWSYIWTGSVFDWIEEINGEVA